jgi:outer membrane protein assembly factor BamB
MMSSHVTHARPAVTSRLPGIARTAAAALAGVSVVLAAAGCSATRNAPGGPANGPGPRTPAAAHGAPAAAGASPAATIPGCRAGAWAEDFTDAGRLAWQVSLPATPGLAYSEAVSPVAVGGVSVFADGNALYALRMSDGHLIWHREFGSPKNPGQATVDELWTWHGSVVAALGTSTAAAALVSLDPATGAVRWRVSLGFGLEDLPVVTSDGVVAVLSLGGTLRAFDLATGRPLWSAKYSKSGLLAAGTVVIGNAGHGSGDNWTRALTVFSGRTGKQLWSASGLPGGSQFVPAPGGRLLMYDVPQPLPIGTRRPAPGPVTAVDAVTGRTLWSLSTGRPVSVVWATPAGVVIATGIPGTVLVKDPSARLYLADLATGRVRWSAAGHTDPYATPVITAANVITVATTPATGTVTDHAAPAGALAWKAVISDVYYRYLAMPDGPNVLVTFPPAESSSTAAGKPSVLLAIDVATGATRATDPLPFTATVDAPITVTGANALMEPQAASCTVPVAPGMAPAAGNPGAGTPTGGILGF